MDEKTLKFLQQHSLNFLEMALKDDRREVLANPDGYGKFSRECGDTVEIFLMHRDGKIRSATFQTDGCLYSVACSNAAVNLATDLTPEEAWGITPQHIIELLETLPPTEEHCAELAVKALRVALKDLQETDRRPWKKFYSRR